jgi:hypothetical protein
VLGNWIFERFLNSAEPHLVADFDEETARQVRRDAGSWFQQTKGEVPYIGGARNVFTPVLIVNVWIISLHRAMVSHAPGSTIPSAAVPSRLRMVSRE